MKKAIALFLFFLNCIYLISCNNTTKNNQNNEDFVISNHTTKTNSSAQWNTVYFETNGGEYIDPIKVKNENITLPIPNKANHTFEGWYFDENLTQKLTHTTTINSDTYLYAKWIKTKNEVKYNNTQLKNWTDSYNTMTYFITPNGFDMLALETAGYRMKITATYEIYYRKDYNVPLDIGYVGAPQYDVSIKLSETRQTKQENQTTNTQTDKRTIIYDGTIAEIKNQNIDLIFQTKNMQNVIYIENVIVNYECYK